jgi:hypothetical protein
MEITDMARTTKRPLEQVWKDRANELYMRFNLLPGYDRPVLMDYVGEALRDAYELGKAGEDFTGYEHQPEPPAPAVVRRRRAEPVAEPEAPVRVMRRRT